MAETKKAIEALPDENEAIIDDLYIPGVNDNPHVIFSDDLKALSASHKQLLKAAKDFRDCIDGQGGSSFADFARDQLDAAIAAAEK